MTVFFLFIWPGIIALLSAWLITRRKPTRPQICAYAVIAAVISLLFCVLVLVPSGRMRPWSRSCRLFMEIGKVAGISITVISAMLGVWLSRQPRLLAVPRAQEALPRITAARIAAHICLFMLIFLTQLCIWGWVCYPLTSIEEIIYYLRMPLQGVPLEFYLNIAHSVLIPALCFFTAVELLAWLPSVNIWQLLISRRFRVRIFPLRLPLRFLFPVFALWFAVLLYSANALLWVTEYIDGFIHASSIYEEEYVAPDSVAITFPEKKRNLITIYVESLESTMQDAANGGVLEKNAIPELTQIAKDNISFSRSDLLQGASIPPGCGWTIAGLIAQSAGVPLRTYNTDYITDNTGDKFTCLLPGAVTLGDILKDNGYSNMFMAGSDFTFGGRRVYYETHGDYTIWDYLTAREDGFIPGDYFTFWGFEDEKLFAYAKEQLLLLAEKEQPFHFAMLTVDTHTPGYRCTHCPDDYLYSENEVLSYADILLCTSMQVSAFVSWLQEQDFYEDTTIVITGDHGTMQDFFYDGILDSEYNRNTGDNNRHVYNAFINAAAEPVTQKNRIFTTLDFFPTVLASMGVEIEGNRLALGVNLFSDEQTLAEKYGEETLFSELRRRSRYYDEKLLYPQ